MYEWGVLFSRTGTTNCFRLAHPIYLTNLEESVTSFEYIVLFVMTGRDGEWAYQKLGSRDISDEL